MRYLIPRVACGLGLATTLVIGCQQSQTQPSTPTQEPPRVEATTAKDDGPKPKAPKTLPKAGDLHPSYLKMADGETFNHKVFSETQRCAEAGCHAQIVTEWKDSMHAFASLNNPLYRVSFEDFVKDSGTEKVKFCGGCHDIALMFDGSISKPQIEPEQAAAHAGVTCNTCHGVTEASVLGNASYTLTTSDIPMPLPNDADSLAKHKARVGQTALRTNALCISCHRGFLTPASGHTAPLEGLVEWPQWRGSAYNGVQLERIDTDVEAQNCVACHMPKTPEGHRSHRFPGGHSSFAAMIGSKAQLDAQAQLIKGAATIDIMPLNADSFIKDGALSLDVVVFNERTGHTFPAGARDLRDTWLEVSIKDKNGKLLASSGHDHAATVNDREAHRFYLHQANHDGQAQAEHNVAHFRAPVFDSTIAPRDATSIRFKWELPTAKDTSIAQPLQIEARLRHRRVSLSMQQRVCQEFKTPRGQAFANESERLNGAKPDPCVELPIIPIDETNAWVGQGAQEQPATPSALPQWRRFFRYGLALQHQVQENLEETHTALNQSLKLLPADAPPVQRAMIMIEQAQVLGRQGRTDDAIALYQQANQLAPDHPAIAYGESKAYMQVWRFDEAAASLERAAKTVNDDRIWRQLAIAYGSLNLPAKSLAASHKGLDLEIRDSHLLRSQMLAYRLLDVPQEWRTSAEESFDVFKRDTGAPGVKNRCSSTAEWCRRERIPVHTHTLVNR